MRQIHKMTMSQRSNSYNNYSLSKSYSSHQLSAPCTPNYWPSSNPCNYPLQKSQTITSMIESNRGFKPSDRKDPAKREFLTSLTQKVFKVGLVSVSFISQKEKQFLDLFIYVRKRVFIFVKVVDIIHSI